MKAINILESSVTDLVGQRDEQQQALYKSPLALATLKENCSKLNEAGDVGGKEAGKHEGRAQPQLVATPARRNPS